MTKTKAKSPAKLSDRELEESQEIEGVRYQLAKEAEAKHKALRMVMKRGDVLLQAKGFAEYVRDHSTGDAYSMAKSLLLAIDSLPRIPQ